MYQCLLHVQCMYISLAVCSQAIFVLAETRQGVPDQTGVRPDQQVYLRRGEGAAVWS